MPVILLLCELTDRGRSEFLVPHVNWDNIRFFADQLKQQIGPIGVEVFWTYPYGSEYPLEAIVLQRVEPELDSIHLRTLGSEVQSELKRKVYCYGPMMTLYDHNQAIRAGSGITELANIMLFTAGLTKTGRKILSEHSEEIYEDLNKHIEPFGGKILKIYPIEGRYEFVIILEVALGDNETLGKIYKKVSDEFCFKKGYFKNIRLLPLLNIQQQAVFAEQATEEARNGVETPIARMHFHDKIFEFHFSPTREYWDFQKAFVESVVEVRENESHLRKVLEEQLDLLEIICQKK